MTQKIKSDAIAALKALRPKIKAAGEKASHGKKHSDEMWGHVDALAGIRDKAIADVIAAGGTEEDIKEIRAAASEAGSVFAPVHSGNCYH